MSKFEKNYENLIETLKSNLNALQNTIQEIYKLEDNAKHQVITEETSVNDLMHFLELEQDIDENVKIRASTLIGESRRIRREAKSVIIDIKNFGTFSDIKFGEFDKICSTLLESLNTFVPLKKKDLYFNPVNINFKKLKENNKCVQL